MFENDPNAKDYWEGYITASVTWISIFFTIGMLDKMGYLDKILDYLHFP